MHIVLTKYWNLQQKCVRVCVCVWGGLKLRYDLEYK